MSILRFHINSRLALTESGSPMAVIDHVTHEAGRWVRHDDHVAEVERLTADLDEMRAMWDQDSAARHRLLKEVRQLDADLAAARAERDGLAKALDTVRAVLNGEDARPLRIGEPAESVDYGRAQLADEVRAALAALPPKEDGRE